MKNRTLCYTLGIVLVFTVPLIAQERSTSAKDTSKSALESSNIRSAQGLRQDLQTKINQVAGSCGSNGYRGSWEENCPSGFQGRITFTCLHGSKVITNLTCRKKASCGSRTHGERWTVNSCPSGLRGNQDHQCIDGQEYVVGFNCRV